MNRKSIIIGNGLGKSIDPEYFDLSRQIREVWYDDYSNSKPQRELIEQCLPNSIDKKEYEVKEEHLDILQQVVAACDTLNAVGKGNIHWLTDEGKSFPEAIRSFIFKIAATFHKHDCKLPASFVDPLSDFLKESKSHIGTLNYDNLLYQPLIDRQVLMGYNGSLVDGFHSNGFKPDNLERMFYNDFGYYLHLHGSPLFIDRDGQAIKIKQGWLKEPDKTKSSHIVLTHVKHKPSVIAASYVLRTYWEYLEIALNESSELIIFGYSGNDPHLNEIIKSRFPDDNRIRIIEWEGAGSKEERKEWWIKIFGDSINLEQVSCLIEYDKW